MRNKVKVILFSMLVIMVAFGMVGCTDTKQETLSSILGNPLGTIQGFVRDGATNSPIEGITVTLYAGGARTTTTDANGYWYFTSVQADDGSTSSVGVVYTLTSAGTTSYLDMMGYAKLNEQIGSGDSNLYGQVNSLSTVRDFMVKPATISGFVTDDATGRGIDGATVVLNLATSSTLAPSGSNAFIAVAPQYTATTAANTTMGTAAAGYYSMSVPALTLASSNLGAYATGYEYSTYNDNSSLNLQYAAAAVIDFNLSPVDNNLGLVAAQVSLTASGTANNLLIMRDASGTAPSGSTPNIDLNGATQMMFSLIFDQAVDTTQFFSDSITLWDGASTVFPSMTPVWANDYSVTLTGNYNLQKFTMGTTYRLRANRAIYAKGNNTTLAAATDIAGFRAINSALTSTNPTPTLYLVENTADTSLVGETGVYDWLAPSATNSPTTLAQNYTGLFEKAGVLKNVITIGAANTWAAAVDLTWQDTQSVVDISAFNLYYRIMNPTSGETIKNWTAVTPGTTTVNSNKILALNIPLGALPYNLAQNTDANLRYGNRIDFAVTVDDSLGVETPIDETKILSLRDVKSPEIAATSLTASDYRNADIEFNEQMATTSAATIALSNAALFTSSPIWNADGTSLELNATGSAAATVYETGGGSTVANPAGVDTVNVTTGVISFTAADEANAFFIGQVLRFTYPDSGYTLCPVTGISTAGATPTVTVNLAAGGCTLDTDLDRFTGGTPITVSVDNTTTLRQARYATVAGPVTAATTFAIGAGAYAVGDRITFRDITNADTTSDITVTVTDYNGTTITFAAITVPAGVTLGRWYFEGDILTVTATDEASNAIHADANEVVYNVTDGVLRIR